MTPRERLTRQNRGEGWGGEEKYACTQPIGSLRIDDFFLDDDFR